MTSGSLTTTYTAVPRISLRQALAFPFRYANWPAALLYIGLIQFIPIIGYLIGRGWRFEIAKRVGASDIEALPDWRHAWEHLKQGALLFGVTVVHYIPMFLLLSWPRMGIIKALLETGQWIYERFFTILEPKPLWDVLGPGLKALAIFIVILIVVPPIISAIVEAATQRYAHTGRIATLFEVWHSIRLACGDLGDVVRIEGSILLLNLAVFVVSVLLSLTVGGAALIPPLVVPIYMWTRGALMGQWIAKNRLEEAAARGAGNTP